MAKVYFRFVDQYPGSAVVVGPGNMEDNKTTESTGMANFAAFSTFATQEEFALEAKAFTTYKIGKPTILFWEF